MNKIYTPVILIIVFLLTAFSGNRIFTTNKIQENKNTSQKAKDKTGDFIKKMPPGYPFITNFSFENRHFLSNNFIVEDSLGNMIFANEAGIMVFDGAQENEFMFGKEISSFKINPDTKKIYLGHPKGFGIVEYNGINYSFKQLFTDSSLNDVFGEIVFFNQRVWFIGETVVYSVSENDNNDVKKEYESTNDTIQGAVSYKESLYIVSSGNKLVNLVEKKNKNVANISSVADSKILFTVPFGNQIIIANEKNDLYLFDGTKFYLYVLKNQQYIKENIISGGFNIDENNFAIYTINGGVLVVDKNERETVETINYRSGLPEDEIFYGYTDSKNNIWVTHESGATRIAHESALKNYGSYPGITGKIKNIAFYDNTLYVSTGKGVFCLAETKDFKEVEKYVSQKTTVTGVENSLKNIFRRKKIFTNTTTTKLIKKQVQKLQSVQYVYKQIPEINAKCDKMLIYNKGLLVASNVGLFYTKGAETKTLIDGSYVYDLLTLENDTSCIVATENGLYRITVSDNKKAKFDDELSVKKISLQNSSADEVYFNLAQYKGYLWLGGISKVFKVKISEDNNFEIVEKPLPLNLPLKEAVKVKAVGDKLLFITGDNVFEPEMNTAKINIELSEKKTYSSHLVFPDKNSILILKGDKVDYSEGCNPGDLHLKYLKLFKNYETLMFDENKNIWFITKDNRLFKIKNIKEKIPEYKIRVLEVLSSDSSKLDFSNTIKLNYKQSNFVMKLSAPDFTKVGNVEYFYGYAQDKIDLFTKSDNSSIKMSNLKYGEQVIRVYAQNSLGQRTDIKEIKLFIKPPFWQNPIFIIGSVALFIILAFIISYLVNKKRTQNILRRNEELEAEVEIRTVKIKLQNQEIMAQNTEILEINKTISRQKTEIVDSINYASKIQTAMLSQPEVLNKYIADFFIYYKPRDIVSGDFYWFKETNEKLIVVAADCTGHGVPGGFISMLGISSLNDIVTTAELSRKVLTPSVILDELRLKVITSLNISQDYNANDGMDVTLIIFDKQNMKMQFAGGNNSIFICSNNEITELKGDRMPIGLSRKKDIPFTNHTIDVKQNDLVYMLSDGYLDQFGGPAQRKFTKNRFIPLLQEINDKNLNQQHEIIENIMNTWQGNSEQIDDMLILGVKI